MAVLTFRRRSITNSARSKPKSVRKLPDWMRATRALQFYADAKPEAARLVARKVRKFVEGLLAS